MKYATLLFIVIYLWSCSTSPKKGVSKQENEMIEVYLKEFSVYFSPDSCVCEMKVELYDTAYLQISLSSCEGKMKFKQIHNRGNVLSEGEYMASLDTLKEYSIGKSAITGNRKISVLKYFQPLPEGKWIFYRKNAKVDTIYYSNGLEVQHDSL